MKIHAAVAYGLALAFCSAEAGAQDRLFVDIADGTVAPLAIGAPGIASGVVLEESGASDLGQTLAQIVRSDLATSPFFRIVESAALETGDEVALLREFASDGAQGLVIGRPVLTVDATLRYTCSFFDVFSGTLEIARDFEVPTREWRRAAHQCADMVVAHTTGYPGHFDTRFAFTAAASADSSLRTIVGIMDFDGAQRSELASARELVGMPRISPDGRMLVFMAYDADIPRLEVSNLETGARTALQLPVGIPSSARFSPDGGHILFALARNGDSDIYEYELATARTVQLTNTTGIDTSPSYAPDGRTIAFESDRSGKQQIYVMLRDGSDQQRITFDGANGSPVWSPAGGTLAFVRYAAEGSRIAVSAPDGSGARILSAGPHDEDPSWASNGRAISFQRTTPGASRSVLWIADIGGAREFPVGPGEAISEPHWSEIAE